MKRTLFLLFAFLLILCGATAAKATPFYAVTNYIGYSGTVTYVPQNENEPVTIATSTPRNAYAYFGTDDSIYYNLFLSNWFEHSTSNVNNSFFQLYDVNADTINSLSYGWNSTGDAFWWTITGSNASYTEDEATNDWSRAWMPDQNTAARGSWTEYTLSLVASGMTSDIVDSWRVNTSAPTSVTGSFVGTFVSEARTYSWGETFENTYWVQLTLSSNLFDQNNFTGEIVNEFGAPVPIPGAVWLLGSGLIGLLGLRRRFGR